MSQDEAQAGYYRMEVVARRVGLPEATVRRCIEVGVVRPARVEQGTALFAEPQVARLRKVRRLREDLGLNMAGVEIVLRLLDELDRMRAELRRATGG